MEKKPNSAEYGLDSTNREGDLVFDDIEFGAVDLSSENGERMRKGDVERVGQDGSEGMGSGVHERIAPISNIEVVEESGRPKNWEDGVKYAARLASDRSVSTNPYELQKLVSELRRALNKLDGGDEGSAK